MGYNSAPVTQPVVPVTDKRAVLLVTCAAAFIFPFMGSSVNVALPTIGVGLQMTAVELAWVATSFLLTSSLLLIPFGRIADSRGRKRVLTTGVAVYTIGSILASLSWHGTTLIIARAIQGSGGAMLASTAVAILAAAFGPGERGKALGINAAALYAGLSIGPAVGGFLTQTFGWRAVFFVNIPLGLLLLLAAHYKLPAQIPASQARPFDWPGFAAYAVFLIGGIYGLTQLPSVHGFASLAIGLVGFVALVRIERAVDHPLIDLSLFHSNTSFAMSNLAAFLNYSAFFAATFLLSLYLQVVSGFTPRSTGLILVSMPIIQAFVSPIAGRFSDRHEPRLLASSGMALTACALFLMSRLDVVSPLWYVISALALLGLGVGLFATPNTNAVMTSVSGTRYGIASATLSTTRQVGMVLSMGIATLFIAARVGAADVHSMPMHLFIDAMQATFALCTVACLAGIAASLARGRVYKVSGSESEEG